MEKWSSMEKSRTTVSKRFTADSLSGFEAIIASSHACQLHCAAKMRQLCSLVCEDA
jgi:hypothetical protein